MKLANDRPPWKDPPIAELRQRFVRLAPDCSIKQLEEPCLYDRRTDDLYIVNQEAVPFLERCLEGTAAPGDPEAAAFVGYCLEEGLLEKVAGPRPRRTQGGRAPSPSLRYLLMHITGRCNLRCRHCFQGEAGSRDLPLEQIFQAVDEFEALQGLRLMISGGEPLMHPGFLEINDYLAGRDLRAILLTNGLLLSGDLAGRLAFQEVQVSLDGCRESHDLLRGSGAYDGALAAIRRLRDAGVEVSVATMVHAGNLDDFDELEETVNGLGVREWSIDVPSPAGRLDPGSALLPDPAVAGPLLDRSFGGAVHETAPGYACGAHLMAVMADGSACRCGFYSGKPAGSIQAGLGAAWQKIDRMRLSQLDCSCEHLEECRGGCRFRASGYNGVEGPDPYQCHRFGVI